MANEDKATKYHRLRRRTSILSSCVVSLLLVLLLLTGGSAALRDVATSWGGGAFGSGVVLYIVLLAALVEAVQLPFGLYQEVALERRYGLSTQSLRSWWLDRCRGTLVSTVLGGGAALIVLTLLRLWPERWWLAATVVFLFVLIGLAQLAPVLLLPIFHEFKPLDRAALSQRLVTLADRAGARVVGVFEWRLSVRTRRANAALAGIGRTRRILLSDTLLAEHSDDEIEVILAHELAHHVHHDIWSGIVVEAGLVAVALYLADALLVRYASSLGLTAKDDIAALPLLLLASGAVSLLLLPVVNALLRAHERRADRYALQLTGNAGAFISAMRRLSAQNLAEEHPSRIVELLFHTHPSTSARVGAARAWAGQDRTATPDASPAKER